MEKEVKKEKSKNKFLRVVGWIFLSLLILIITILLFIRSPWGQGIIVNKLVSYISDKTNTIVRLDKAFITFSGDIQIEGLYLEDKNGDTLIYSKLLDADIPLMPLIKERIRAETRSSSARGRGGGGGGGDMRAGGGGGGGAEEGADDCGLVGCEWWCHTRPMDKSSVGHKLHYDTDEGR